MHEGELWQVFSQNGLPIAGRGEIDDTFHADPLLVMSNVHVWLWRRSEAGIDVLLQKRSLTKKQMPGYFHISSGGHIDLGETPVEAAVRETQEEMGLTLDGDQLYLVHVTRTYRNWNDLKYVYLYELQGDEQFSFDDGEVDSVRWVGIKDFEQMTAHAEEHHLVPQGDDYFRPLIAALRRKST